MLPLGTGICGPSLSAFPSCWAAAKSALHGTGTARIGAVFGPVMVVWFLTLGVLGLSEIVTQPGVLAAVSPSYAVRFFAAHGRNGFLVLGSVVLCVTGHGLKTLEAVRDALPETPVIAPRLREVAALVQQ